MEFVVHFLQHTKATFQLPCDFTSQLAIAVAIAIT